MIKDIGDIKIKCNQATYRLLLMLNRLNIKAVSRLGDHYNAIDLFIERIRFKRRWR
jgi:hypothetical protein